MLGSLQEVAVCKQQSSRLENELSQLKLGMAGLSADLSDLKKDMKRVKRAARAVKSESTHLLEAGREKSSIHFDAVRCEVHPRNTWADI